MLSLRARPRFLLWCITTEEGAFRSCMQLLTMHQSRWFHLVVLCHLKMASGPLLTRFGGAMVNIVCQTKLLCFLTYRKYVQWCNFVLKLFSCIVHLARELYTAVREE